MRIDEIQREIQAAAHALNDIKTVIELGNITEQKIQETVKKLSPRIQMLEQRIDRLMIELAKEKNKKEEEKKNNV